MSIAGIISGSNLGVLDYNVDIVICIDMTESMKPLITEIKNNMLSFYEQFKTKMANKGKNIQKLRAKFVLFSDFMHTKDAIIESRFFKLDEYKAEYLVFFNNLSLTNGKIKASNSLEALTKAFMSNWEDEGTIRRQVVLLFSDKEALDFKDRCDYDNYPYGMPNNLVGLHNLWDDGELDSKTKRLMLFTPNTEKWLIIDKWVNTYHTVCKVNSGCSNIKFASCLNMIVESI